MLKFNAKLKKFAFDELNYTKTLNKIAGQISRESARRWYRYIISKVPVDTGMAKASLIPLGRHLKNVPIGINPIRKPYLSKLYGRMQSPEAGEEMSYFEVWDDKDGPEFVYGLVWETDVLHFWLSTYWKGSGPPGSEIVRQAAIEYETYFERSFAKRLPPVEDFMAGLKTKTLAF